MQTEIGISRLIATDIHNTLAIVRINGSKRAASCNAVISRSCAVDTSGFCSAQIVAVISRLNSANLQPIHLLVGLIIEPTYILLEGIVVSRKAECTSWRIHHIPILMHCLLRITAHFVLLISAPVHAFLVIKLHLRRRSLRWVIFRFIRFFRHIYGYIVQEETLHSVGFRLADYAQTELAIIGRRSGKLIREKNATPAFHAVILIAYVQPKCTGRISHENRLLALRIGAHQIKIQSRRHVNFSRMPHIRRHE